MMVFCCGTGCFTEENPEFIRLKNDNPISEREQPANIPVPVPGFDGERDALLIAFFPENLERCLFSYALSGDWFCADRSAEGCRLVIPAPEKVDQKIGRASCRERVCYAV